MKTMKLAPIILLLILLLSACDFKWGLPKNPVGPSEQENEILVSYTDVKSNYLKNPGDFTVYINAMDNVEWTGKIVAIDISNKITIYVAASSSNLLILTMPSDLIAEAGSNISKTIAFEAKITNYTVTGDSFTLTGNLIKIIP